MQNGRQIDLSEQVERVKRRTRPWKAFIALLFAIAAAVISDQARHDSPPLLLGHEPRRRPVRSPVASMAAAFLNLRVDRDLQPGREGRGNCSGPKTGTPRTRR